MSEAVHQAVAVLRAGGLVALPTETVYGLAADAANPQAVARVFALKGRPATHPLIVHIADTAVLEQWAADVPAGAQRLAEAFWPGPLTLILKRQPQVLDAVTGGQDSVGLRVPAHPLALAVLAEFGGGIAAPSANPSGKVSPTTADHVVEGLGDRIAAAAEQVEGGPIDVLTGDWLAELTMLILSRIRAKRPGGGFASTFVAQMEQVMGTCLDRGIKVVSNAGGLDPDGCAEAVAVSSSTGRTSRGTRRRSREEAALREKDVESMKAMVLESTEAADQAKAAGEMPELGLLLAQMLRALVDLLPIIALFAIIIGTIYKGWATPTEAAAVGVAGAILIAAMFGGVSLTMFAESILGTVKITSMIMLVVIGASFLNFTLASAGLGRELQALLDGLGLSPTGLILVVVLIYIEPDLGSTVMLVAVIGLMVFVAGLGWRYVLALMVGRLPRFLVVAWFGHTFPLPTWFLLLLDGLRMQWRELRLPRDPACPVCGTATA